MMGMKLRACGGAGRSPWKHKLTGDVKKLYAPELRREAKRVNQAIRRHNRVEIASQIDDHARHARDKDWGDAPMDCMSFYALGSDLARANHVWVEHEPEVYDNVYNEATGECEYVPIPCACEYCNVEWYRAEQEWKERIKLSIAKLEAGRDKLIVVIREIEQAQTDAANRRSAARRRARAQALTR